MLCRVSWHRTGIRWSPAHHTFLLAPILAIGLQKKSNIFCDSNSCPHRPRETCTVVRCVEHKLGYMLLEPGTQARKLTVSLMRMHQSALGSGKLCARCLCLVHKWNRSLQLKTMNVLTSQRNPRKPGTPQFSSRVSTYLHWVSLFCKKQHFCNSVPPSSGKKNQSDLRSRNLSACCSWLIHKWENITSAYARKRQTYWCRIGSRGSPAHTCKGKNLRRCLDRYLRFDTGLANNRFDLYNRDKGIKKAAKWFCRQVLKLLRIRSSVQHQTTRDRSSHRQRNISRLSFKFRCVWSFTGSTTTRAHASKQ